MKLVQNLTAKTRHFEGVDFPFGEAVELPPTFPADKVRHLLAWGWTVVAEEEPEASSVTATDASTTQVTLATATDPEPVVAETVAETAVAEDNESSSSGRVKRGSRK